MLQGIPSMMVARGSGGAAPDVWTERATDNFVGGAASADLTTSGHWTANQGIIQYVGDNVRAANASVGVNNVYSYTGTTFLTNQYSQFTIATGTASSIQLGPAVRIQAGAQSGYLMFYQAASGGTVILNRYITGSGTNVATITSHPLSVGNKMRLEAVGTGSATRLTAYEDTGSGWVAITSLINIDPGATYLDGGSPGLYGYDGNATYNFSVWSGGDKP